MNTTRGGVDLPDTSWSGDVEIDPINHPNVLVGYCDQPGPGEPYRLYLDKKKAGPCVEVQSSDVKEKGNWFLKPPQEWLRLRPSAPLAVNWLEGSVTRKYLQGLDMDSLAFIVEAARPTTVVPTMKSACVECHGLA